MTVAPLDSQTDKYPVRACHPRTPESSCRHHTQMRNQQQGQRRMMMGRQMIEVDLQGMLVEPEQQDWHSK